MPILAALAAVTAAGCGLGEYEQNIEKQEKRIAYIDQENRYLGPPVEWPPPPPPEAKPKTGLPPVFFRPPRGMLTKADPTPLGTVMYRFGPKPQPPNFGGAKKKDEEVLGFLAVFVGVKEASVSEKDFKNDALQPFGVGDQPAKAVFYQPPGREQMAFDQWAVNAEGNSAYYVYLYRGGSPAVVAFQTPPVPNDPSREGKLQALFKAMEYSIQSLAVGGAAGAKQAEWRLRK